MDVWLDFPICVYVCLFAAFLATVQATLLLFARLERSRTPTFCMRGTFGLGPDRTLFLYFDTFSKQAMRLHLFSWRFFYSFFLALYLPSAQHRGPSLGGSNTHLDCRILWGFFYCGSKRWQRDMI
jgi:hypothetical protein